jgi:S-adenosyl-L-methionine hydrolase (adenosine-forming)
MAAPPLIALLSDFGLADGYVGVLKGVILGIAPGTQLVDLTHDVPPGDVRTAAWILATAWRSFPVGAIFLCVVDPGVGTARRPLALAAGERVFVGPDNGLFSYVLAAAPAARAVTLDNPAYHAPQPSATFHGRDIFAPCAAHLAAGTPLSALGVPLDPAQLVSLPLPTPTCAGDELIAHVLHVDRFGNLITDIGPALAQRVLTAPDVIARIAGRTISARAATFADGPPREPFLLRDSSGHLAIAVRDGSAAALLGAGRDAAIEIVRLARAGGPASVGEGL